MQTQVWILVLLVIVPEAVQGAADCNKKETVFNSKSLENPKSWIVLDWNEACGKLTGTELTQCTAVGNAISASLPSKPIDEVLFEFKTSATTFIGTNSARQFLFTTQLHSSAADVWGTVQELFNCFGTDCGMLSAALGQAGEVSKLGQLMKAECQKFFADNVSEMLDCGFAAGGVTADAQTALNALLEYTSKGTNTLRMSFLATIKIDSWGGTAAQAIQCSGKGNCDRLPSLLVYYTTINGASTKFTDSMDTRCSEIFSTDAVKLAGCASCARGIEGSLGITGNQANPINTLVTEYGKCTERLGVWKEDFEKANADIANWGTIIQAMNCSGFVPSSTTPAASTSTGSTGSPGSTASTTAPPNPDCLASRKQLLLLEQPGGEYKIIAPLVAACAARLNATEQAECTKTASAMRAIVSSTSTTDDKKLEDLTTELIKFGNATSDRANIIVTTDITSWNVAASGAKTYMKFITCQRPGNCELSQIMFTPFPNGESYASTNLMTACQRNNSPALCTTLMNEVKKCTQGPLNFMPATEADRIVRAQSILSSSTTKIDANAPFGDWGTVGQFTACK